MNIYQFMSNSPILTFFIVYFLAEVALKLGGWMLRSLNVAIRGWPPAHLDADGDWKPKKERPE